MHINIRIMVNFGASLEGVFLDNILFHNKKKQIQSKYVKI